MQFKLIDKKPRSVLCEGRNYGIGFAFAKRVEDTLVLVQPISPCKDYLNDVLYSETTGNPYSAWGLRTKKENIFVDQDAYVVFAVMPHFGGNKYEHAEAEIKYLDENLQKVADLVNRVHDLVEKEEDDHRLSIVHKIEDNRWVMSLPSFWLDATYKISLWSSLVRTAVEGRYIGGDPIEFLKQAKTTDMYNIKDHILPKLDKMMKGVVPKQDMTKHFGVHDCGICTFKFPA